MGSTFEELQRRREGFKRLAKVVSEKTGRARNLVSWFLHIPYRYRRKVVPVAMNLIVHEPSLEFLQVAKKKQN